MGKQFDNSASVGQAGELESWRPAREASFSSDVLVPAAQAAITGVLLGAVVAVLVGLTDFDGSLVHVWAGCTLAVTSVAWLILLGQHRRLLWLAETFTGQDLDGDRQVGKPAEPKERLILLNRQRAKSEAATERQEDEFDNFLRFVFALRHRGTSLDAWERQIGRGRYQEYRNILIDGGYAKWCSYNGDGKPNKLQGWELTSSPESVAERLCATRL